MEGASLYGGPDQNNFGVVRAVISASRPVARLVGDRFARGRDRDGDRRGNLGWPRFRAF